MTNVTDRKFTEKKLLDRSQKECLKGLASAAASVNDAANEAAAPLGI
jgi:hypothetical protein